MKEKILFINKFNSVELLRTSTLNCGNNLCINYFYHEDELIDYILEKRAVFIKGNLISGDDISGTILKALNDEDVQFEDAQNIKNAFDSYEECVINDVVESMNNTLNDDFPLKKEKLINAYIKYQTYKKENNKYDVFDQIRLILSLDWTHKFSRIIIFKEYDLTKTQKQLLKIVFNDIQEESIKDYIKNKQSEIKEIVKAYGSINEINEVFNKVNDKNLPLGQCQIVLINSSDIYHIINKTDYLSSLNGEKINVTYRLGYPILLTRPGQMFLAVKKLYAGLFGVDAYDYLFESRFFNRHLINGELGDKWWSAFKKYVGWLRMSFEKEAIVDAEYNEIGMKDVLKNFNEDIKKGIPFFIHKYCLVDGNNYDQAALKTIKDAFSSLEKYDLDNVKIIDILLQKNVNPTLSAPNALHVTTLDYAFESNRPYTFIVGLSSDYPGQASENSLIFDKEYKKIDESGYYCSSQIIKRKEQLLKDFVSVSGTTFLSYPFYRLVDQKDVNPSSYIAGLFLNLSLTKKEKGFNDDKLSNLYRLINDYQNNNVISNALPKVKHPKYDSEKLLKKKYSPSLMANYFFGNKLIFILGALFNINIDNESSPFEIIPANEKGTLIHDALKNYQEGDDKEEVRAKAKNMFRNFMKKKPSDLEANVVNIEEDFMKGVDSLLSMPLGKEAECERYNEGIINGMFFGGTFDRVAVINHKNVLIDYKTGSHSKHDATKKETFIQGLIYAGLITQKNPKWKKIDEIWFVYPYEAEDKKIMKIAFDDSAKETLYQCVETIKQLIVSGDFTSVLDKEDEEATKYTDQYAYLFSLYEKLIKQGDDENGVE